MKTKITLNTMRQQELDRVARERDLEVIRAYERFNRRISEIGRCLTGSVNSMAAELEGAQDELRMRKQNAEQNYFRLSSLVMEQQYADETEE